MCDLYEDVRDFVILHYKLTQRGDTPFWRYVRDMDVPESLTRRMELWRLHGRIFREGVELFTTSSWIAVLLGQNLWPNTYDPIADSLDEEKVAQALRRMRDAFRKSAETLPTQEQFLRRAGAWAATSESSAANL